MRINIIANIFKIIKMLIYIRVSLLTKPTVSVCNMFDVSYPQFVAAGQTGRHLVPALGQPIPKDQSGEDNLNCMLQVNLNLREPVKKSDLVLTPPKCGIFHTFFDGFPYKSNHIFKFAVR